MKTYTVLFAEDVPHYGTAEIQAKNHEAALRKAKSYPLSEVTLDAEWENSACKRIVWIEDSKGNTIAEDVSLDDSFLRYGGDKERALCDTAPYILEALEDIAELVAANLVSHEVHDDAWKEELEKALAAIAKAKGSPI